MYLEGLNKEQIDAVKTTEGLVRVVAGAGTGKTRALTHRYVYLHKKLNIPTSKILSVTFTNKAANEMKERIQEMLGIGTPTPAILTFHGFCNRMLREYIGYMGYSEGFKIMDTTDQKRLLKGVYDEMGIKAKDYPYQATINKIIGDGCKTGSRDMIPNYEYLMENTSAKAFDMMMQSSSTIEEQILLGYLKGQKRDRSLDYDDLINFALYIIKENVGVRHELNRRYDYIQVDEFQDVSQKELEIVSLLSEEKGNLFVVGDPDQLVYGWRGADIRCIVDFENGVNQIQNKGREVQTIILNKNYRSTKHIIAVSNSLIKNNKNRIDKELVTDKEGSLKVTYHHAQNIYREAEWVVDRIKEQLLLGKGYDDIAILYRNNANSRAIEEKLIEAKYPYEILSGISFYQRKEIKDILAVLSLAEYGDNPSFQRVVENFSLGLGKKRIEYLEGLSESGTKPLYEVLEKNIAEKTLRSTKAKKLLDLVSYIRENSGRVRLEYLVDEVVTTFELEEYYKKRDEEERYENILELKDATRRFKSTQEEEGYYDGDYVTVGEYLNTLSLYSEADKDVAEGNIKLMTVHASKGLEFPVVFLITMTEGIMPSGRAKTRGELEEERRVAYVALTRAEDCLFMSDGGGYNFDNTERLPSRFLFNIKQDLINVDGEVDPYTMEKAQKYIEMSEKRLGEETELEVAGKHTIKGLEVEHDLLGKGQIIQELSDTYRVDFGARGEVNIPKETQAVAKKVVYEVGDRINHALKGQGTVVQVMEQGYVVAFENGKIEGIKYDSQYIR